MKHFNASNTDRLALHFWDNLRELSNEETALLILSGAEPFYKETCTAPECNVPWCDGEGFDIYYCERNA
jgi:hypothetical protein